MKQNYRMSYVLFAYNNLPNLRQVVGHLVAIRRDDEEIIVADGGSEDGTGEWLRELRTAGKIQQYVSEHDKGRAYGLNKCMIIARGEILQIISDDSAFCYPAIRQAASFMLANPHIDVLTGRAGYAILNDLSQIYLYEKAEINFNRWFHHKEIVPLVGLPLLIRRSSLALTGLFYAGVTQMDAEFTYRITGTNVSIAWMSALLAIRLEQTQTSFFRQLPENSEKEEIERIRVYYDVKFAQRMLHRLWKRTALSTWFAKWTPSASHSSNATVALHSKSWPTDYVMKEGADHLEAAYEVSEQFMAEFNERNPIEYLHHQQGQALAKAFQS